MNFLLLFVNSKLEPFFFIARKTLKIFPNTKRIFLLLLIASFYLGCKKDSGIGASFKPLPIVTTGNIMAMGEISALASGTVTADSIIHDTAVTDKGICYSTSANPTISSSKISCGKGMGSFSCTIKGLAPNTTYYVRAYATDSVGTAYGNQQIFKTVQQDPAVTVYINAGQNLYALNATNGSLKWRVTLPDSLHYSPTYSNNTIYVFGNSEKLYALDTLGNIKWVTSLPANPLLFSQFSEVKIEGYNNMVFVRLYSSSPLFALNATNGSLVWTYQNNIEDIGFTIDNNLIYLNCSGNLTGLDVQTGSIKSTISGSFTSVPLILNNKIYVLTPNADLNVYDKSSGSLLWSKSFYYNTLGGAMGYIDYNNGVLYCSIFAEYYPTYIEAIDTVNGNKIFSSSSSSLVGIPELSNNVLYFINDNAISSYDALTGALIADGGSPSGCCSYNVFGGMVVANGVIYYATIYDEYPSPGHVYGLNTLTQIKWTSTVSDNFYASAPCVVVQSGRVYVCRMDF